MENNNLKFEYTKETLKEPLILTPDDHTEEEWKFLCKKFGFVGADEIRLTNVTVEAYGRKINYYGTPEDWQNVLSHLTTKYGEIGLLRSCGHTVDDWDERECVIENLFMLYESGDRSEGLYNHMLDEAYKSVRFIW